jgi:hypothetical protein
MTRLAYHAETLNLLPEGVTDFRQLTYVEANALWPELLAALLREIEPVKKVKRPSDVSYGSVYNALCDLKKSYLLN